MLAPSRSPAAAGRWCSSNKGGAGLVRGIEDAHPYSHAIPALQEEAAALIAHLVFA